MKLLVGMLLVFTNISAQSDQETNDRIVDLIDAEKYKEALPLAEKLLTKYPDDSVAHYNHAVICFHLKKYMDALNDYRFLSVTVPTNAEYPFQMGNIYETLDSLKKATEYYSKALVINNKDFLYYFKRGTCYLKMEWYDEAIVDFNHSLRLNESHHNSFHNRGIAYYKKGEKEKACEDWCQALLLGNPYSATHLERNCKQYPTACLPSK
ncbi:MAG TPA: tetratricopeptide repeat protein [Cyclobacteriaceae bacterium]|nr:tetratricopeptide repeat protein [Cyclobacteriaceae bacterium]